jgi:hypothetical protein
MFARQRSLMDIPQAEIESAMRSKRMNAAIKHAQRSAKQYANVLLNRVEGMYLTKHTEVCGDENAIAHTMQTYGVHEPLRHYAAKIVLRLVSERGVR